MRHSGEQVLGHTETHPSTPKPVPMHQLAAKPSKKGLGIERGLSREDTMTLDKVQELLQRRGRRVLRDYAHINETFDMLVIGPSGNRCLVKLGNAKNHSGMLGTDHGLVRVRDDVDMWKLYTVILEVT